MPALDKISSIKIELLDRNRHDRAGFDCGVPALNAYLQRQAAQDVEKRAAVVYVAVIEPPVNCRLLHALSVQHRPYTTS